MQFTGKNLVMVLWALNDAIAEVHNQIATCPDVIHHADAIEEYEKQELEYTKLKNRVEKGCRKLGLIE
jgi:hypothetical protein